MEGKKVAAIVPAFNEEKTIKGVVEALLETKNISEVIVVDDGSLDQTSKIAKEAGARVIKLKENKGKGTALEIGTRSTDAEIFLFSDADLLGIKSFHFERLLFPVLESEVDMTIGTIDRRNFGKVWAWLLLKVESPFAGTRVLKREFWESVPEEFKKEYFVESALTYFAKKRNLKIKNFILEGVFHLIKERKYGFSLGVIARTKMFFQIIIANILLRLP
ncbi:MAG: glycosyltransferase family 2 protein [Candidatus Pacebacteria bacterium]|nr:glycosyltransferase family 2 protein [Candidatus Paceibacterota bacterium]